jgi:hypothetical protein
MLLAHDFEAMTVRLDLFTLEQGGQSPSQEIREVRTVVHHRGDTHSCIVWFDKNYPFIPGKTAIARMGILMPEFRGKFKVGEPFALWQGKVFAVGVVQGSP